MTAVRHYKFVEGSRGTTHEVPFIVAIPCKNFVIISVCVEVIYGPKISVFECLNPKIQRNIIHALKGRSLRAMMRLESSLVQIGRAVYTQAFPCICENLGNFGGPQLPYQTSLDNPTSNGHHFDPVTKTRNKGSHSAIGKNEKIGEVWHP